jgi:hypothetical protein
MTPLPEMSEGVRYRRIKKEESILWRDRVKKMYHKKEIK